MTVLYNKKIIIILYEKLFIIYTLNLFIFRFLNEIRTMLRNVHIFNHQNHSKIIQGGPFEMKLTF